MRTSAPHPRLRKTEAGGTEEREEVEQDVACGGGRAGHLDESGTVYLKLRLWRNDRRALDDARLGVVCVLALMKVGRIDQDAAKVSRS